MPRARGSLMLLAALAAAAGRVCEDDPVAAAYGFSCPDVAHLLDVQGVDTCLDLNKIPGMSAVVEFAWIACPLSCRVCTVAPTDDPTAAPQLAEAEASTSRNGSEYVPSARPTPAEGGNGTLPAPSEALEASGNATASNATDAMSNVPRAERACGAVNVTVSVAMADAPFPNSQYDRVLVTGSYNNWGYGQELSDVGDGTLKTTLQVAPGASYEYVFIVTGPADNYSGWGHTSCGARGTQPTTIQAPSCGSSTTLATYVWGEGCGTVDEAPYPPTTAPSRMLEAETYARNATSPEAYAPSPAPVEAPLPSNGPTTIRPAPAPSYRPTTAEPAAAPTPQPVVTAEPAAAPTSRPVVTTAEPTSAAPTPRPVVQTAEPSAAPTRKPIATTAEPTYYPSRPPTIPRQPLATEATPAPTHYRVDAPKSHYSVTRAVVIGVGIVLGFGLVVYGVKSKAQRSRRYRRVDTDFDDYGEDDGPGIELL